MRSTRVLSTLGVATIGYEGRSLDDFLAALKRAAVERVVDVRALPLSRKKGFSKNALARALEGVGIGYVHLREAGNPFRGGDHDTAARLASYAAHLDDRPEVLVSIEQLIGSERSALLCFERSAADCHRSVIVDRLLRRAPTLVVTNIE